MEDNTITKDLRLNLQKILEGSSLEEPDRFLALLATARSVGSTALRNLAVEKLQALAVDPALIDEAESSAAIMGMLNTYYRFRHMVSDQQPDRANDYRTAGLRMTALAKPLLGKQRFEMLAFAVSVLNGCETCINAHEKVLREAGLDAERVHDLARLASIVRGLATLEQMGKRVA